MNRGRVIVVTADLTQSPFGIRIDQQRRGLDAELVAQIAAIDAENYPSGWEYFSRSLAKRWPLSRAAWAKFSGMTL